MNHQELNSYEAYLKGQLQKAEEKRLEAEAGRINLYRNRATTGIITEEQKRSYLKCVKALSEKGELKRILAYIQNLKMTPAQRKAKVQELKLKLAELKA